MAIYDGTAVLLQATGAVAALSALIWALFWLRMRMVRATSPWMCAGNSLFAMSLFLLSFRHHLPVWLAYWVSDGLGIAGIGVCFVGIHVFARREPPMVELAMVVALCAWFMWRYAPDTELGWIWSGAAYSAGSTYLSLRAGLSSYRSLKSEMGFWPCLVLLAPIFGVSLAMAARFIAVVYYDEASAHMETGYLSTRSFMWAALTLTLFLNVGACALAAFRLILKLRFFSDRDTLTGAVNRRAILKEFQQERLRSARHLKPYSVIMVDLDHFKAINDTWGHAAGDAVLKAATQAMGRCIRQIDLLARWGGEEFCCLLPMTPAAGAMIVAERMRACLKDERIAWGNGFIPVRASFGVSSSVCSETLFAPQEAPEAVIRRADEALYVAKERGRDQAVQG